MIKNLVNSLISQDDVMSVAISQKFLLPYFSVNEQFLHSINKLKLEQDLRQTLNRVSTTSDYVEFRVSEYFACAKHINRKYRLIVLLINQNQNLFSSITHKISSVAHLASVQNFQVNQLLDVHSGLPNNNLKQASSTQLDYKTSRYISDDVSDAMSIDDLLCFANRLSEIVTKYLGAHVTTNFWKETKPDFQYLDKFIITQQAKFEYGGDTEQIVTATLHLGFKLWLNAFFERASKFIFNLPELIEMACGEQYRTQIVSLIPATYTCMAGRLQNDDNSLFSDI